MPLITARLIAVNPIGRVQIKTPSTKCSGVVKGFLFDNILLFDQIITLKPAAFALSGDGTHPFQCHVIRFRELA
jgi:hypothetical protein